MRSPSKRVTLGKPIARGPEELDRLSQITPADIETAKAVVSSAAPLLAAILEAERIEDGDHAQPPDGRLRLE